MIGRADEENDILRRDLDKINSDYNALKASHDTEKAVTQNHKADYRTLVKSLQAVNQEVEGYKVNSFRLWRGFGVTSHAVVPDRSVRRN